MSIEQGRITVSGVEVDVLRKPIRNAHLAVYPPHGRVRLAVPLSMTDDAIRLLVVSKLAWLQRHRRKLETQEREAPREFVTGESHYFLGRRYLLRVVEGPGPVSVRIMNKRHLVLHIRSGSSKEQREQIMADWYRSELRALAATYFAQWTEAMGVRPSKWGIKVMRTKWGSCNHRSGSIWLNLELARKPVKCVEYIVVHELAHLLEHTHDERFVAYMDRYMPQWRMHRQALNRLPVRHVDWVY